MEQTANSLGATSAYDLACRYNNLFQYSPAAAAACAAAYGMFGGSTSKSMGSSSSPFQPLGAIATSSLPSSSSSNLTSSPTSSLSSLVSNNSKQDAGLAAQPSAIKEEKCRQPVVDECMDTKSKTNNSYENVSENDASMSDENGSDDDEHNLSGLSECAHDDHQQRVVDINKMQQKLNAETEKSIASCMDELEDENSVTVPVDETKQDSEHNEADESTSKKGCVTIEEHSIGSLMNTLVKQSNSDQPRSIDMKYIGSNELDVLRKNLIDSVSQAIQSTLDSFCKTIKQQQQQQHQYTPNVTSSCVLANNNTDPSGGANSCVKHEHKVYSESCDQTRMAPAPKRIRVNEKIAKNSSSSSSSSSSSNTINNNSQNFNVSKILSKETHTNITNNNNNNNGTLKRKFSTNGLLGHQSDSFGSFNSASFMHSSKSLGINPNQSSLLTTTSLNNKQQHLSNFYSAMSQLQPYASASSNNNNGSVMHPNFAASTGLGGVSSAPNGNSASSISSLFAAHQHHLLMAAAQAAAASTTNGQNSNYLQMAAAANRLFTPYLIDQHASQPKATAQMMPSVSSHHTPMFHSPHKRRRTKVTDTRLSPRNPFLRTGNKPRDDSPNNNDEDDQNDNNNNNNDYEDEHQHNNQEDDSVSSGCNESGSTTGSNCRITNAYSNQYDLANENTNDHYTGYQTSTLSSLHLRKAKLMFFFSRYPSSTILRNFFPDVKFNKANTAQLVKWFSNFREFFYIQMEKFARQHLAEGMRNADEIQVDSDSEIFRALNSHYNRNNQLEIPASFCFVIQATLREFFKAIQEGKDMDPSWKKAIYKIIARMDDQIPEYFKSIQWMESLETNI